ncbi:MAG TPA: CoA-transferase [Methylomirabilota bacterium]|jgi:glutaconate CoA-transferase, subunit B
MAAASAPPSTAAAPASIKELMATFLARDMVDGEEIFVGTNLPVIRAGVLLAHLHHGPNMRVMVAHTRTNLYHTPVMEYFELLTDWRGARWAEAYFNDNEIVMYQKSRRDSVFFVGALQIDPFGNSNLIGLGKDRRRLALRGPGAIATTTNASHVRRFYLFVNEHSPRVFVPRCDFVSTVGWAEGGADARRRLGLPGGGPRYCVTPLAVMDFEETSKRMRLHSVHPGVTVDHVRAQTGFELLVPAHVPVTPAPTAEELLILRGRVDPQGLLRR